MLYFLGIVYLSVVVYIANHPVLVLNGLLTGFGSTVFADILFIPITLFVEKQYIGYGEVLQRTEVIDVIVFLLVILLWIKMFLAIKDEEYLNPVQLTIIKYIHPGNTY